MTRDRFLTLRFKPYMELWYVNQRLNNPIPVMLLAIDWDNDVFNVIPFPDDPIHEEKSFWCSIDYIELPTKRMKVVS